jgi:hypothetical protein
MTSGTRKTEAALRRLANDPATKEYLEAGIRLITAQFQGEPHGNGDGGGADQSERRPFFDWLSQSMIVKEVSRGRLGLKGNVGTLRDRWPYHPHYIEDLLSYALWSRHYAMRVATAEESRDLLATAPDLVEAIHLVAYRDLCVLLGSPAFRVSLIAAATADRDVVVRRAITESYRLVGESWSALYQATLAARGLRLRSGVTLTDLTDMLTALAEGIGMRMLSDPNAQLVDHERQQSLLGKAAIAIAAACIDTGDGKTLEELVALLARPPTSPEKAQNP